MLTKDEAELYDRQIRLWGVSAQSRLRQSKVLMLGFNGVASEVAKILVLAGIDTLTIVDDQPLQSADATSNLFCRPTNNITTQSELKEPKFRTHQVQDKLRILNPLVKINIDNSSILDKKSADFKDYDLVTLHSFLTIEQTSAINDICRENSIKFYLVLDYGFFGFMFSDLGDNFKFTYEEYNSVSGESSTANKQSGEAKDPISVEDDVGYGSSGDDDDDDGEHYRDRRPKKRPRLETKEEPKQDKDKDEKKHIAATASYVTFQDMISFKGANFDKKTSPILFVSVAMMKFYSEHKHLPRREGDSTNSDDLSKLNQIIASMRDSLKLNEGIFKKLDPEWSRNIIGSLSPVCAIVGGVAGQDMIRALSGKDLPICNTFSFDGNEMMGVVEKLGIEDKRNNIVKPVVRDLLQIDDD